MENAYLYLLGKNRQKRRVLYNIVAKTCRDTISENKYVIRK